MRSRYEVKISNNEAKLNEIVCVN